MIEIDEFWFLKSWGIIYGNMTIEHAPMLEQLYAQMMGWA